MNTKVAIVLALAVVIIGGVVVYTSFRPVPSGIPAPLPAVPDKTITLGIGETKSAYDIEITPFEVVEDSRCPSDVQCIQAGTVRLVVNLRHPANESSQTLTLGTPVILPSGTVTLSAVTPAPRSTTPIAKKDYQFTFTVNSANTAQ